MTIKVLLSDFQFLTKQGVISVIESIKDFQVIDQLVGYRELESAIERTKPNIVVLEVYDQEIDLLSVLERIIKNTEVGILALCRNLNREYLQQLLDTGVLGIITKDCSEEEITSALREVSHHRRFLCHKISELVFTEFPIVENDPSTDLSQREYEVLKLIAQGNTSSKIAEMLFVSVHTINSHRKNILKKLNMKSPAELVVYAIQNGMIEGKQRYYIETR